MEVIDLGINDLEPVSLNLNEPSNKPSVSFGGGIELLMNDKKKSSSTMNLNLGELDSLENELNELTGNSSSSSTQGSSFVNFASNMFGINSEPVESAKKISLNIDEEKNDSNLGNATRESIGNNKTWDGFSKITDVPMNNISSGIGNFFSSSSAPAPSPSYSGSSSSKLSDRDRRRKQRMMIKKMEEWYEKGLTKHNSHFNMDSDFTEVEDEYESAMEDKRRKDSVKLHNTGKACHCQTLYLIGGHS